MIQFVKEGGDADADDNDGDDDDIDDDDDDDDDLGRCQPSPALNCKEPLVAPLIQFRPR